MVGAMETRFAGPPTTFEEAMATILRGVYDPKVKARADDDEGEGAHPSPSLSPRAESIELNDEVTCNVSPHADHCLPLPQSVFEHADAAICSTRGIATNPMERYWVEPQRHERIAVMMAGKASGSTGSIPSPSTGPSASTCLHHRAKRKQPSRPNDRELGDGAVDTPPRGAEATRVDMGQTRRSPSPAFHPGLVIDVDADYVVDDDEPDVEAIKIAARIKSEQIYRGGVRQCRLGRVRKKICRTKRPAAVDPDPG